MQVPKSLDLTVNSFSDTMFWLVFMFRLHSALQTPVKKGHVQAALNQKKCTELEALVAKAAGFNSAGIACKV